MLRVRNLYACSAAETARYYTRYLDEPDEEPGLWRGGQAVALGLTGTVDTDQLETLLSGRDPASGNRLGSALVDRFKADGTRIKAVAGYDATFSAPKSLSVWWALTGDPGLLDAHDVAVGAVLDHLEAHGSTTRIRRDGGRAFVDTGGLTMATFRQSTSREDDPQIHTHAVISTKVQASDGRWYALDARYLKRKQRALGGIYQSALRTELTHRYGVEWGPIADGQAELAAMPDELLDAFSKRARQVEHLLELKLMGFRETEGRDPTRWERAAITREAAADSRQDKSGAPVTDLRQVWNDEAADLGWTGPRLTETLATIRHRTPEQPSLTVEEVLDRLSTGSSTWLPIDVMRVLCDVLSPDDDQRPSGWRPSVGPSPRSRSTTPSSTPRRPDRFVLPTADRSGSSPSRPTSPTSTSSTRKGASSPSPTTQGRVMRPRRRASRRTGSMPSRPMPPVPWPERTAWCSS